VSWLLVAAIPAQLMLATIGLERVETDLNRAVAAAAAEVTAFLEHVEADAGINPQFHPTQQPNRV
jgi:hypothetical protein